MSRPRSAPLDELTVREREVLELVAEGLSNQEIGDRLGLAEKTIKHYMTSILGKLRVRSRVEAALVAYREGITPAPADPGRLASPQPPSRRLLMTHLGAVDVTHTDISGLVQALGGECVVILSAATVVRAWTWSPISLLTRL